MLQLFAAGVGLSLLLVVPPWPFLNRHPLTWLPKGGADGKRRPAKASSKRRASGRG